MSAISYWESHSNMTSPLIHDEELQAEVEPEISRFSRPLLTFAATATIIIMIVGILGNLLTIVALLRCPKVRNVAAAFIISLCCADLLFCSLVLPFSASRFVAGTWTSGDLLCRLVPFMRYGNIGVSLLSIAMITVNRYIMIAHPSVYPRVYRPAWITLMLVTCWCFSYGMQVPTLLGVWGAFSYDARLGTCSIMRDQNGGSSKTALFLVGFALPCAVIVACYAKIFWVVHSSELRMRKHAQTQNAAQKQRAANHNLNENPSGGAIQDSNPNIGSDSAGKPMSSTGSMLRAALAPSLRHIKDSQQQKAREVRVRRNEWRITKMVLAIFLSFVICYLPITIAKVADSEVRLPGLHILGYILLYLSACINPIIYVIMNKQYRQAYKTVLLCERPRLLNFTAGGSSAQEKSKEQLGYSYNHSRTMVSQVSIADHPGASTVQPGLTCIDSEKNSPDDYL